MKYLVLLAATLMPLGSAFAEKTQTCAYEGLTDAQCKRVADITERWHATPLGAVVLAGVEETPLPSDVRPNPELDAVNAKARAREALIGACRYDEAEGRVEVKPDAFKLSDAGLAQCLATAYAQARYYNIEAQWLKTVGAHEAWIVKNGIATKVGVDTKIETTAARLLWTSFAVRELLETLPESPSELSRAIASNISSPHSSPDPDVRKLLGFD